MMKSMSTLKTVEHEDVMLVVHIFGIQNISMVEFIIFHDQKCGGCIY